MTLTCLWNVCTKIGTLHCVPRFYYDVFGKVFWVFSFQRFDIHGFFWIDRGFIYLGSLDRHRLIHIRSLTLFLLYVVLRS